IALQEVLAASEAGYDTAAHLAKELGLNAAVLPLRRKRRAVEGQDLDCTAGLAVLSRRPICGERRVGLPTDSRDGERGALIIELEGGLTIACLHLTHLADADELRRRQWRSIKDKCPAFAI